MSFYSHFRKKSICEWREYYVSYKVFKKLFVPFKKTSKVFGQLVETNMRINSEKYSYSIDSDDIGEEITQLKIFEEKFMTLILVETEKIDSFFQIKFMEFQADWIEIQANAEIFHPHRFDKAYYKKMRQMKNAFHLFYMKVNYLIQFVNLNYDAISRLLRKHRKITKNYAKMIKVLNKNEYNIKLNYIFQKVSDIKIDDLFKNSYINQNSETLLKIRDEVTTTFLELFYHRYNKDHGVKELKFLLKTRIISVWHSHFLFLFLGCTLSLLIFILIMAFYGNIDPDDNETFKYIFPMFRGSAFIVIYIWLLGWNVYVWTRYHINYKKIFQFNYHFSTPTEILMRGTFFSSILLIIFIWYIILNEDMGKLTHGLRSLNIPKEFLPLILWALLFAYLFFPSKKRFNGEGRLYFFKRIYRYAISPIVLIDNPSAWVADQLLSFVIPLQDLAYTICYYSSRINDYDNMHPNQCFSNSIYVGFLVAIIPVVFRVIQFSHYLYHGSIRLSEKEKEIVYFQKIEEEKLKKKNEDSIDKKTEYEPNNYYSNNDEKEIHQILEINDPSFHLKIKDCNSQISCDSIEEKINTLEKTKQNSLKFEKKEGPVKQIEDKIQKNLPNEILEKKLIELETLKKSYNLTTMIIYCLLIVACVTIFSFLSGKSPENKYFLGLWITFAFLLATYAFYLDIIKDWALCQPNKKHPFLREKLGYQRKSYYYLAIILNFFLRFVWTFSISPGTISRFIKPELFTFFMGGFEMLRRAIWNFMVVEKIFVTNLESYKCLYEYELPFSPEEIECQRNLKKSIDLKGNETKKSGFHSSDNEDEFKFKFIRNKKQSTDLKKGLLEDSKNVIIMPEEKEEDERENEKSKINILRNIFLFFSLNIFLIFDFILN